MSLQNTIKSKTNKKKQKKPTRIIQNTNNKKNP